MNSRSLSTRLYCLALLGAASAALAATDPIEGRWIGVVGSPLERVEVGLEFKRNADGTLSLLLTQPIMNYFAVDAGTPERAGDRVTLAALALDLRLKGDRLEGTFPGPKSPAALHRTEQLPVAAPPPELPPGPAPLWQTRLGGLVYAAPTLADGVAYIGATGGVFQAVNISDGSLRWTYSAGRAIHGQAAVDGDAVYFVCDDGYLYKLASADGKLIWRYALGDAEVTRIPPHPAVFDWDWRAPQPLIADGVVYVGAGDGGFHAVDALSGSRHWRFDTRGRIRTGAAIAGTRVIFGSADHFVYALERADGREVWRFDSGAEIDTTPVVHQDRVLIGNRGGGLYALDLGGGAQIWRLYFWGSWVESTPVVVDDTIYVGASDLRRVSAIDFATGKVRWRSDVYGWSFGTPLIDGDRIHVGAAGGTPYFIAHQASYSTLDRRTGKLLTRRALADAGGHQWGIVGTLALSGDRLVYATVEGSLFGLPWVDAAVDHADR